MRKLPLRARVVLASTYVLALGVVAIGITINVLLTNSLNGDADAVLRAKADAQLATVGARDGRVVVSEGNQDQALDREAWVFAGGRAISRPRASVASDRAAAMLAAARRPMTLAGPDGLRLRAQPAYGENGAQIATVVVGISLRPYEESERVARIGTIALGIFVVFAGALIAWRAVGAGLRPVARMAHQAAGYSEHELSHRFGLGPPRDELTTLAATLDGLLDRLEASLRREQRLTAEIAHELRTPLSGIRAEAELAAQADAVDDDSRASLATIVSEVDHMDAVIGALLRSAGGLGPDAATCELRPAIASAVDSAGAAAAEQGVALGIAEPFETCRVGAEAAFVAQLLSPLLDNALRHAATAVRITAVATEDHAVRVCIHDDGPGIAEHDADAVFEPGWQTPGGSGAGLGLALARRLARSLGGEVRVGLAAEGAQLVVELPVVTSAA
jgi:signal transduction histidine kinase